MFPARNKRSKKNVSGLTLLLVVCFSFIFTTKVASANIVPIVHFLLCGDDSPTLCASGMTLSGDSALGGPFAYYNLFVRIDGGTPSYLGVIPGQAYDGENYSYRLAFFPSAEKNYQFRIQAADHFGLSGPSSDYSSLQAVSRETQAASGPLPVADPGESQIVATNSLVTLDGSGSFDAATGASSGLLYFWEIHYSDQPITLFDDDSATPSFTPSVAGTYIFRLYVGKKSDADGPTRYSQIRYVRVVVKDDPDTAIIAETGPSLNIPSGQQITLNGSQSQPTPANGGSYRWELLNRDQLATTVDIVDPNNPVAHFTPDTVGTHVFRLTVYGGEDFDYQYLIIGVYNQRTVGSLIEQDLSSRCGFSCTNADLDDDGDIDNYDSQLFSGATGTMPGDSGYDERADFNRDRMIDRTDELAFYQCLDEVPEP